MNGGILNGWSWFRELFSEGSMETVEIRIQTLTTCWAVHLIALTVDHCSLSNIVGSLFWFILNEDHLRSMAYRQGMVRGNPPSSNATTQYRS